MAKAPIARTYTNPDRPILKSEVFTPRCLIDRMMDTQEPGISELDSTFFEPAAGDGNIVIAVLERKLNRAGWTTENAFRAVKSIYACEYMKDNRDAIVRRIRDSLKEHGVEFVNAKGEVVDWCYSKIQDEVQQRIVWCNTVDPWDTTDENGVLIAPTFNSKGMAKGKHRAYPKWLISDLPEKRLLAMSRRGKSFYKQNKSLWEDEMRVARNWEEQQKVKDSGQLSLDDIFG